jgi:hypothetical protein
MEFNKLVFAGLAMGCIAAAGGGAYLALRHNTVPQAIVAPSAAPAPGPLAASPAVAGKPGAVTESEGLITPAAPVAAPAPVATAPVNPAPRREPQISSRPASTTRASNSRPAPASQRAPVESSRPAAQIPQTTTASNSGSSAPASTGGMWEPRPSVQPSVPDYKEPEPPPPPPPPAPEFIEITVPPDAVLGLQIERTISSELARVEDKVEARVTRDVRVDGRVAIPAGSTVKGSVTEVDRGSRLKGKARLAVRFHTVVLADGTQLNLKTDPVVREGQSSTGQTAAKVGGAAIGGAILGAILGGGKGAAIGAAAGGAGGTAAAMANQSDPATLTAGSNVSVRMQAPVTVAVQKE